MWEPGFLQLGPGRLVRPLSFAVDALGPHYDATAPSELERRLQGGGWQTAELLARAEAAARRLVRIRGGGEAAPAADRPRVVVLDQPAGDPSLGFGLAGPARSSAMLAAAIAEHPDADIHVLGPASGEARGAGPPPPRTSHLAVDASRPLAGIVGAVRVYTVSSVLGFEALLAGVPVTCFGAPFYAGWGLTDDRLRMHRRTRRRTAEEVFAAAYILGSRYFDPYTGEPTGIEEALDVLDLCGRRARENACTTLATGFAAWKREWVDATLGAPGHPPRLASTGVTVSDAGRVDRVVAWASREPAGVAQACREAGTPLVRMEDGFLRSVGLGVGLRPGSSYVLDSRGVYYDATAPSDLEVLLQTARFDAALLSRAARLREAVVAAGLSKYNVGGGDLPRLPADREIVLVAGQVENDASIRLGLATTHGNAELLRRVREATPHAFIAYKPHPDVEAGLRPGRIAARQLAGICDVVLHDCSAPAAILASDRIEVATSLLGFEALLRGRPVTTHGLPFYAGWGLTTDPGCVRRTRRLQLDELVAAALILYPRYLDPATDLPCEPEVLVRRLVERAPETTRVSATLEAFAKRLWSAGYRAGRIDRR